MDRPEIVELFYRALFSANALDQFLDFLWPRVEWILEAADPLTLGEESPTNAIKFSLQFAPPGCLETISLLSVGRLAGITPGS
jgi:hypothetical protein